jgi:hypothetical protein
MIYKGFTIEEETEPWAIKYSGKIKFYRDSEKVYNADSKEEAIEVVDAKEPFDMERFSEIVPFKKGEEKRAYMVVIHRKGMPNPLPFTTDSFHAGLKLSIMFNAIFFERSDQYNAQWL